VPPEVSDLSDERDNEEGANGSATDDGLLAERVREGKQRCYQAENRECNIKELHLGNSNA